MGNYDGALASYNRAISVDAKFQLAYNNRGVLQMDKGRLDDAEKDFKKALELKSDYSAAASNLSGVYFKKKEYKPALDWANKAVKMDKENAAAYVNRGMAREMTRDMVGACEDWHTAKELGSETGKNYYSGNCGF